MPLSANLTLQDWPMVAQQAGIDPGPYAPRRTWVKDERDHKQVTVAFAAPGLPGLIVKQFIAPDAEEHFTALVLAQTRAAAALDGHAFARVPRILATDTPRRIILMQEAPGETLRAALDSAAERAAVLAHAGAWAAAFHAAGPVEPRAFQPRFMVDHLGRLAQEVAAGQRRVPNPPRFTRLVNAVQALAPAAQGARTVSAQRHGDLQARNLILGQGLVWGIDLGPPQTAPVGYDIARFLIDHAAFDADLDALAPGEFVPQAAMEAFFRGYHLTGHTDGAVRFLMAVRLVLDWAGLPPDPDTGPLHKAVQFRRLEQIAANALP